MLKYCESNGIIDSFSKNHVSPYSAIALQEMNLAFHYPIIYWNTACLSVNAGANENNDDNKGTDYGTIASAIGGMQFRGVKIALPNINKADFGFKPDIENEQIIFGLKGINGIGNEVVHEIVDNRPYTSFDDFFSKMVVTGKVKQSQLLQLIKAGCFDDFEDRIDLVTRYVTMSSEPKNRITMQNFSALIENGVLPSEYNLQARIFKFKKYISKNVHEIIPNTNPNVKKKVDDKHFLLDNIAMVFFNQHFGGDSIVGYEEGRLIVSEKLFTKEYNKHMESVKQWIKDEQETIIETLNEQLFNNVWEKCAKGTISTWEMDSLCYYYHDHEMKNIQRHKYGVVNFFDLEEQGNVASFYEYRGKKRPKYEIYRICGTVLDKDKYKHTVSLLTPEGVVTVKFYGGAFAHYDKQISKTLDTGKKQVVEKSWFKRGNKIVVAGFRRGKQFIPRTYTDSIYQHTVSLVKEVRQDGTLRLKSEREEV